MYSQILGDDMRLKVSHSIGKGHLELASAVSWEGGHLVSGSEDQTVQRWTTAGQHSGQVCTTDLREQVYHLCTQKSCVSPDRSAAWTHIAQICSGVLLDRKLAVL